MESGHSLKIPDATNCISRAEPVFLNVRFHPAGKRGGIQARRVGLDSWFWFWAIRSPRPHLFIQENSSRKTRKLQADLFIQENSSRKTRKLQADLFIQENSSQKTRKLQADLFIQENSSQKTRRLQAWASRCTSRRGGRREPVGHRQQVLRSARSAAWRRGRT